VTEDALAARSARRRRYVSIGGVVAFVAGSGYMVARNGLYVSTDDVLVWVIAALVALSLSDLPRVGLRLLWDWLPFGALLIAFHYAHGIQEWLGTPIHWALQIHFDELLFGKPLLTVQLQHLLHQTRAVRTWEIALLVVYLTYFFLALVVAAILWRFAYPRFREFRAQFVVLTALAVLTYVLYPADPPWIASQQLHQLPTIYRVIYEVWGNIGLHTAHSVVEHGSAFLDPSAAVPSLHAGATMLVCLFFWKGAPNWARALLVFYVLAMAFTLVYSGEHYVFDIVLGWLYAIVVVAGAAFLRRRRKQRRDEARLHRRRSLAADPVPLEITIS
jgi:membrane-associated phospholipid phosphatase